MSIFRIVSDIIVGLAWPTAIVAIALIFKNELRQKFNDLIEAGPTGVKFGPASQRARAEISVRGDLRDFPKMPRTPFIESIERDILGDLEFVKVDDQVPLLLRNLAQARIEGAFESIFASIFQTQITFLNMLQNGGGRLPLIAGVDLFETTQQKFQEALGDWQFDRWLAFLEANLLALREGSDIILTEGGRDFLAFVSGRKAGFVRPL